MNNHKFLITNISQLLLCSSDKGRPLRGKKQSQLELMENAALLIEGDKILDFGDNSHFKKLYGEVEKIDAEFSVVMPGFVDPHTHLVFAGSREEEFLSRIKGEDYLSNLGKGKGILYTVEQTRNASFEKLYEQAKKYLYKMLENGTTSCESKSGYGLDFDAEIRTLQINRKLQNDMQVLVPSTLLAAHALPQEYQGDAQSFLTFIAEKIIPYVAENNLADFIDVFCEKGVFNAAQSEWILKQGQRYGMKPKIHTDEFFSIGGIEVAINTKAVSADHLMKTTQNDMIKLSSTDIIGVVLPGTSFNISTTSNDEYKYPRSLVDSNIPVAIGTDFNPGTCMCCSMQMMLELSVLKMGLSIEEAINASTINSAFACSLHQQAGSIEREKKANMILLNIDNYKKIPYLWGINKVYKVLLNGKMLDFKND